MIGTLAVIVLVVIIMLLAAALWLASLTMAKGKRQTLEEAFEWQSEHYDTSFYSRVEKTDYTVRGEGGYLLHVQLLKNPKACGKYVIITHGYTDNRMGALKYAAIYLDLGYNCIIYDLRGHGENAKAFTTYSILEAKDLASLIADTRFRYTDITQLGLHGESLGAATTVTSLQYAADKVDFAIADCGFSDIENVLRCAYRKMHLPGFLVDLADMGAKLRYHYSLKDMRPADSLDDNHVPVMFIHGADDSLIPPKNSQDMYDRTKGKKEIHLIPGAEHAVSVLTDPVSYRRYMESFLEQL